MQPYDPKETEERVYQVWEQSGYFNPDNLPGERKEPFVIMLPPPNVTGVLHIGHAAMLAVEDILIRTARMQGKQSLWLPGTDSAAIATQSKVEKEIYKKEKKTRHDLGRAELLSRIDSFTEESKNTILNQVRRMGSSLDWSRYAYTLDEKRYNAVTEAFIMMYETGLIYRGTRVINWDPKGQTTISDDEVVYEEREVTLYTFKYSQDFPIAVSTTRPETKVGDTAVAVNPDDDRYKQFIGKEYEVEFAGTKLNLKVVASQAVDKDYGTGALGVTPAHSRTDEEIAKEHSLLSVQVINEYVKMTEAAGPLVAGKKTKEAREIIVAWLKEEKLLEKEEVVDQNVSTAERTGAIIEPLPKLQWFVDVNKEVEFPDGEKSTLKERMKRAVASGSVAITPDRFERVYFDWIEKLYDWCISRQIWFGHRIPVWYKNEEIKVQKDSPGEGWEQDPDTLDTWFSSGLWTFSTLGWPQKTKDLKQFHPTTVLETGYDILFFWVARMILMSEFLLGEVPFKKVYLHGLVRDQKGRKMSKSLGNIIDPLAMIEKYGADATRLSLIIGAAPGNDIKLSEDRVRGYKHFANKLWNISRFVLENTENFDQKAELTKTDTDLLKETEEVSVAVTKHINEFRLDLAGDMLYHYVWDRFASEIIEESKPILSGEAKDKSSRQRALYEILITCIKLLHPFMPFVTEEVWQYLPQKDSDLLIVSAWPSG